MRKKILSILLTLCMVLTLLPTTALAITDPPADTTPPASPVYSPLDSATGVAAGVTPTLTFSEALYGDASGTTIAQHQPA